MLKAEALVGEAVGTLRGIGGDAEFVDGGMRMSGTRTGRGTESPIDIEVDGKLSFAWEPLHARIELLSGLRWRLMADGKERWRANGRLERTFAVRMDDGVAISESQFPFTLHLPQRGQWEREVERVKASGDPGLGDWRCA